MLYSIASTFYRVKDWLCMISPIFHSDMLNPPSSSNKKLQTTKQKTNKLQIELMNRQERGTVTMSSTLLSAKPQISSSDTSGRACIEAQGLGGHKKEISLLCLHFCLLHIGQSTDNLVGHLVTQLTPVGIRRPRIKKFWPSHPFWTQSSFYLVCWRNEKYDGHLTLGDKIGMVVKIWMIVKIFHNIERLCTSQRRNFCVK